MSKLHPFRKGKREKLGNYGDKIKNETRILCIHMYMHACSMIYWFIL